MDKTCYTDKSIESFACHHVFKDCMGEINSVDISPDGKYMAAASEDNTLHLYDIEQGKKLEKYSNKRYGVKHVCFTHTDSRNIICASQKEDARIMYWSLHDNIILFSFIGHTDEITGLQMNPLNDTFLSTSKDLTVRVWSLKDSTLKFIFTQCITAAFDNTGQVLAIAHQKRLKYFINMYSAHSLSETPFGIFTVEGNTSEVQNIKFSTNGQYIMWICEKEIQIIDAYSGESKHKIGIIDPTKPQPPDTSPNLEACFSPDSKYMAVGCPDGKLMIYSLKGGNRLFQSTKHIKGIGGVLFDHRYALLVSAAQNICIWTPTITL